MSKKHTTQVLLLSCLMGLSLGHSALAAPAKSDKAAVEAMLKSSYEEELDDAKKKAIITLFRQTAKGIKLHVNIQKLITSESMYPTYHSTGGKHLAVKTPEAWRYDLYYQDGLVISLVNNIIDARLDKHYDYPLGRHFIDFWRYEIEEKDLAVAVSKQSPQVKTDSKIASTPGYFSLPEKQQSKLKDKEKIKSIHSILNQNMAAMIQLKRFDLTAFSKGELITKILHHPHFLFGAQAEYLQGQCPENERSLREKLGYLISDPVELSQQEELTLKAEGKPVLPLWYKQIGMRPNSFYTEEELANAYNTSSKLRYYCVTSNKDPEQALEYYLTQQINSHLTALQSMQEGLQAIAEEAGISKDSDPNDSSLSTDQQILAGWCNSLNYYQKRLKAARFDTMVPEEILGLSNIRIHLGAEHPQPLSQADLQELENIEIELDEKRETSRRRIESIKKKRAIQEQKIIDKLNNEWGKKHGYKKIQNNNGGWMLMS